MSYRGRDMRRGGSFSGGRGRDNNNSRNVDDRGRDQPSQPSQGPAVPANTFNRGVGGLRPAGRGQSNGPSTEPQGTISQPGGTSSSSSSQSQAIQPSPKAKPAVTKQETTEPAATPAAVPTPQNQASQGRNTPMTAPQSRPGSEANALAAKGESDLTSKGEKKFTGRCRLFVGNLPADMSEDQFGAMFREFGEITEVFLNARKGFGFVKMETRALAEAAKGALDGKMLKGRQIRVRFATHGAALKVKNLPAACSNELLVDAFSMFGEVERAIVIVDDKGRSSGEGIVEFARKPSCNKALSAISEGVFMLTRTPRPVAVEVLEQKDDEDGLPEKYVPKNSEYQSEMEEGPRFAAVNSFEYEFGQRWKRLDVLEKEKMEQVRLEMKEARENLEMEMDSALHEYKADLLRQDLIRRQAELDRLEAEKQKREMLKRRDMEARRQQQPPSMYLQSRQDDQQQMRQHQDDVMRRNSQFGPPPPHQQFGPPQGQQPFGGSEMGHGGPGGPGYGSSGDDGNAMLKQQSQILQRDVPGNQRGPIGLTAMQQSMSLGNPNNFNQPGGPMNQGMPQDFGGRMSQLGNMHQAMFDQAAAPNFNSQGPMIGGSAMGGPQQPMGGAGSGSGPAPFPNMPGIAQASMIRPPRDADQFADPKRRRFL